MTITASVNELSKVALMACDASYVGIKTVAGFTRGDPLIAYNDTPKYPVQPKYAASSDWKLDFKFEDPSTGFRFIAYVNARSNEVMVAMAGVNGPDPQSWSAAVDLGWKQWNENRELVFGYLDGLKDFTNPSNAFTGKIHFTGQSMGGALAEYAAFEFVQGKAAVGFDESRVTLTTFNGLGGREGLMKYGKYAAATIDSLQGLGSVAHYFVTNDLVHRLGTGHIGTGLNQELAPGGLVFNATNTYLLDYKSTVINPKTGQKYALNTVDAHRIETGFYPNLDVNAGFMAAKAQAIDPLMLPNLQNKAALLQSVLNGKDTTALEAVPRLYSAILIGTALRADEADTLMQALLKSWHASNDLSDRFYGVLSFANWGLVSVAVNAALLRATGGKYLLGLLGGALVDGLTAVVSGVKTFTQAIGDFVTGTTAVSGEQKVTPTAPPQVLNDTERAMQFKLLLEKVPDAVPKANISDAKLFDLEGYAKALTSSAQRLGESGWFRKTEEFVVAEARRIDPDDPVKADKAILKFALALHDSAQAVPGGDATLLSDTEASLKKFLADLGYAIGKTNRDFQGSTVAAFSMGPTVDDATYGAVRTAFKSAVSDPANDSVRAVIEEALKAIEKAGQAIHIAPGLAAQNPFDNAAFNPHTGPVSVDAIKEGQVKTFTIFVPYEAQTGGQRISLSLSGSAASKFKVLDHGDVVAIGADGKFTLVIAEGQRAFTFGLWAKDDVDANQTLSLSATLVDASGVATHQTHLELNLALTTVVEGSDTPATTYTITGDQAPGVRTLITTSSTASPHLGVTIS